MWRKDFTNVAIRTEGRQDLARQPTWSTAGGFHRVILIRVLDLLPDAGEHLRSLQRGRHHPLQVPLAVSPARVVLGVVLNARTHGWHAAQLSFETPM